MKNEIRMALLVLASASAPAFAQDGTPQCAMTNFDGAKNYFTVVNPAGDALNQQCFLTVLPKDGPESDPNFPRLAHYPSPQLMEGTYEVTLTGGGGGGGGGALLESAGGGSGAVPLKVTRYLSPGIYRLTIGTGGQGGRAGVLVGENGGDGNPTSMSNAYTSETIAGFHGAEVWAGRQPRSYMVASSRGSPASGSSADDLPPGSGARGVGAQSDGGDGGRKAHDGLPEKEAQDGGWLKVALADVPTGRPGRGGRANGGGGGGAGYGDGADGAPGDLGYATSGGKGGDGFVALRPIQLAQATPQAAPPAAPVSAPAAVTPPARKKDRN